MMPDETSRFDLFQKALKKMPLWEEKKKIFEKLAEMAKKNNLSQEEREKYEESRKIADDWYSCMYGAWLKGYKEAIAKQEDEAIKKTNL